MGQLTQPFRKRTLDAMFTTAEATTLPDTFYLALSTTVPEAAEGDNNHNVTEPTDTDVEGGTYAREQVDGWDPATIGEPVVIGNSVEEVFPDLGDLTISGIAIFDAAEGGQCVAVDEFETPIQFQAGVQDPASLGSGDFTISLG